MATDLLRGLLAAVLALGLCGEARADSLPVSGPIIYASTFSLASVSGGIKLNVANGGITNAMLANPSLTLGSTALALGSTTSTVNALTLTAAPNLGLRDTSGGFDVTLGATSSSAISATRTLTFDIVNGSRTLKLGSNLTIATDPGTVNGAIKSNGTGTFTQANCAAVSDATSYCSATVGQLPGTTTNDSAAAGKIGEIITSTIASGSAVALVTATAKTVTLIALTAGQWDICATLDFTGTGTVTYLIGSISATNDTLDATTDGYVAQFLAGTSPFVSLDPVAFGIACRPLKLAAGATYYLVAKSAFGTNVSGYGTLYAERRR